MDADVRKDESQIKADFWPVAQRFLPVVQLSDCPSSREPRDGNLSMLPVLSPIIYDLRTSCECYGMLHQIRRFLSCQY